MSEGINTIGIFRKVLPIITAEIRKPRGLDTVVQYNSKMLTGVRMFSNPTSSSYMRDNLDRLPRGSIIIMTDLYVDVTSLARCVSQSVSRLRFRLRNLRCRSDYWNDI